MIRNKTMILLGILLIVVLAACDTPADAANPAVVNAPMNAAPVNEAVVNEAAVADTAVAAQTMPEPVVEVVPAGENPTVGTHLAAAPAASAVPLTEAEIASLNFMREEEKLAHDVYVTLYDLWGLSVFQNIAQSEQTHTDSVLAVLQNHNLPDPATGNAVGVFVDPALQNLYDQLVSQGSQSLLEALRVGATIEEVDIIDLDARLAQTDNAEIQITYENLLSGSENHLRSFVNTLERQTGEVYAPQYLTAEAYAAIISGQTGRNSSGQANGSGGSGAGQGAYGQGNGQSSQLSQGQGGGGRGYRGGRGTAANGQGGVGQP